MSSRIQLVIHPESDGAFASDARVALTIDLPAAYTVDQVVEAIRAHLRVKYPIADVHVGSVTTGDVDATWHVYRDGVAGPRATDLSES